MGYKDAILNHPDQMALWGCTACDTCDEVCPGEIPITEIIDLLKNYAVAAGKAPAYYPNTAKTIMDNGMAVPVQAAIEKRREKLGIPAAPKIPVDDVKVIMEICGIPALIDKCKPGGSA
jgi:heterodisulfide reductase subunit C